MLTQRQRNIAPWYVLVLVYAKITAEMLLIIAGFYAILIFGLLLIGGWNMEHNWCLLAIAILSPYAVSVEGARELYDKGKLNKTSKKNFNETLFSLKKAGKTYKEIAEIYHIKPSTVYSKIRHLV